MECVILASGSHGNCIYIGNSTDGVVVDAGLGYVMKNLKEQKIKTGNIRALCITHEHSDHTRSAKAFLKSSKVPVLATGGTLNALIQGNIIPSFTNHAVCRKNVTHTIGSLTISSFGTYHDAIEPCGFVIDDIDSKIGVCLDTHKISESMFETLSSCDAVILESNYSVYAMENDRFPDCKKCMHCGADCRGDRCVKRIYPKYLKDRIRLDGHLSNEESSKCISKLSKSVDTIALAHLSENYNRPNIARELAEDAAGESGCRIFVSDQLPLYQENRIVKFQI